MENYTQKLKKANKKGELSLKTDDKYTFSHKYRTSPNFKNAFIRQIKVLLGIIKNQTLFVDDSYIEVNFAIKSVKTEN